MPHDINKWVYLIQSINICHSSSDIYASAEIHMKYSIVTNNLCVGGLHKLPISKSINLTEQNLNVT